MVKGDQRLDALVLEGGDEVLVIGNALWIFGPSPARDDPGPGDGQSVVGEAHSLDEGDVVHVLVVAVAGHLGVGPLGYVAWLSGVPRPDVPNAGGLAALIPTSLDLYEF